VTRVQAVYTPPDRRRRGYAGATVGAISRASLDRGLRCVLYTDLSNPVSNSVYRRLGYRAVTEVIRYVFEG
jgi:predicted GNAT family acetyltransferase